MKNHTTSNTAKTGSLKHSTTTACTPTCLQEVICLARKNLQRHVTS